MSEHKTYRVDWAGDLNASSPSEAAHLAMEALQQDHTASIFSVTDKETGEISVHDCSVEGPGTNYPARLPTRDYTPRSLRLGMQLQTREGYPAEVIEWACDGDFPLKVRFQLRDGTWASGMRTKAGTHPQAEPGKPHPYDIIEVTPFVTKWLRVYDRKLNENGKQVVGGKEFAAERGLFLYLFDTEEEARSNLQGCRAVFPIHYREGEGLT